MGVQAFTFSIWANSASIVLSHTSLSSPFNASLRNSSSSLIANAVSISSANLLSSTTTPPLSKTSPFGSINSLTSMISSTSSGSSTSVIAVLLCDVGACWHFPWPNCLLLNCWRSFSEFHLPFCWWGGADASWGGSVICVSGTFSDVVAGSRGLFGAFSTVVIREVDGWGQSWLVGVSFFPLIGTSSGSNMSFSLK